MVTSGVVWCFKDNQLIPLQLNAIRLHGVLTQAHWAAISEFLQRVANKQLVLQENGFTELTEHHKQLLLKQQLKNESKDWQDLVVQEKDLVKILGGKGEGNNLERKTTNNLSQILENEVDSCNSDNLLTFKIENKDGSEVPHDSSRHDDSLVDKESNLFIANLFKETDRNENNLSVKESEKKVERRHSDQCNHLSVEKKNERRLSDQNDEIVVRLLKKYCKYSRDALDNEIVSAIEACGGGDEDNCDKNIKQTPVVRRRKLGYCPKEEKLYENFNEVFRFNVEEHVENQKNEHVLKWLKEQQRQKGLLDLPDRIPTRRHSAIETSPSDSRKSSLTSKSDQKSSASSGFESRKSSVTLPLTESRKSSVSSILDSGKFSNFNSRKNSITSNSSCSESDEGLSLTAQWQKILRKHLGTKSLEKRLKKQREAWARNTRKLSSGSDGTDLASQP